MSATPLEICTQQDVLDRIGGDKVAAQLLDPGQTGTYDTALITRAIRDATSMVAMSAGNNFKIWMQAGTFPQAVVLLTALIAVYLLWGYGSQGQAAPPEVLANFTYAQDQLAKIEAGQVLLGDDPNPPARRVRRVNNSECGRRYTYATAKAFGPLARR